MPFLAELAKLVATLTWTLLQGKQGELFRNNSWQKWRVYAVLAFIYMLINVRPTHNTHTERERRERFRF